MVFIGGEVSEARQRVRNCQFENEGVISHDTSANLIEWSVSPRRRSPFPSAPSARRSAEGRAVAAAMEAIARQPEAAGTISRTLFVGLAMIETMAIYCLVVALLVLFANPFIH